MAEFDFKKNLALVTSYGRSVSDVCRRSGINRQQYNRYLSGQSSPTLSTLRRICDFFGLEDHEIFLDHQSFAGIIRLRPPVFRNTEDPVSEYVRNISQQKRNQDDPMRKYEGYYHSYILLDDAPTKVLRSLISIRHNGQGWITKSIERYPASTYSVPRKIKYKGIAFFKADRLILMEQEVISQHSTWTNVMYTTDFDDPSIISGLSMGISPESSHDIVCFRTIWEFLGKQPDLRSAVRACGLIDKNGPSIPNFLSRNDSAMSLSGAW